MAPRKKALPVLVYKAVRLTEETRGMVEAIGPISNVPVKENWYAVVRNEDDGDWVIDALLGDALFRHFFAFIDRETPNNFALVYERKFS